MPAWRSSRPKAAAGDQDATFKNDSLAKLGQMYGAEFKRNVAHVDAFLDSPEFPAGIKDKVLGARLPNGRLAGSDPEFIDFLYQQALFKNPIATVMGGNSEANIKSAEARIAELVKLSGDPTANTGRARLAQAAAGAARPEREPRQGEGAAAMSAPPTLTALVPLKVTNRGAAPLVVVGEEGDTTLTSGATADTHSVAATLAMIDSVKAEVQAAIPPAKKEPASNG
jgi:hypothetical protein